MLQFGKKWVENTCFMLLIMCCKIGSNLLQIRKHVFASWNNIGNALDRKCVVEQVLY
jgi:predicted metal-binding transcription factor (methanogenesis marker protein 9)